METRVGMHRPGGGRGLVTPPSNAWSQSVGFDQLTNKIKITDCMKPVSKLNKLTDW